MVAAHPRHWIQKNYRSFNGLRGVAILMVFYSHLGRIASPLFHAGLAWTGVDLFFVLSGFLITGILYESKSSPSYFRDFYIRRSLRILPMYWGVLTVILVVTIHRHLHLVPALVPDFLFVQNLLRRHVLLHPTYLNPMYLLASGPKRLPLELSVLWSLCVEEQFYLLWPFLVRFIARRDRLLLLALGGAACVLFVRLLLCRVDSTAVRLTNYVYYTPFTRFDNLLIGAALNLWLQHKKLTREQLRRLSSWTFFTAAGVLAIGLLVAGQNSPANETNPVNQSYGYTLVGIAAGAVLLRSLDDTSRMSRVLRNPWLQALGRVSYGFYVLHFLCPQMYVSWAEAHAQPIRLLLLPVTFLALFGLASLSFHYYESPFLRLKQRLAPGHRSVPSGSGKIFAA